jgi:hypothetical protein
MVFLLEKYPATVCRETQPYFLSRPVTVP